MMYSILKLYIQNNLPNMKINVFFYYSKSGFEFRIKKIKTRYTTF